MNRDWLAFAGTVIGGFPIYKEAWENLLKRRMTTELSMTIALPSALAIEQFFTAMEQLPKETVTLINLLLLESRCQLKKPSQSKVFAGTINKNGVLEVGVERVGRDTTFGKIIQVVEQAEKSKAPVQRIADRLACRACVLCPCCGYSNPYRYPQPHCDRRNASLRRSKYHRLGSTDRR